MQSSCLHLGIRVFVSVYLYICMFSIYLCVSVFSFATRVWWNKMNIQARAVTNVIIDTSFLVSLAVSCVSFFFYLVFHCLLFHNVFILCNVCAWHALNKGNLLSYLLLIYNVCIFVKYVKVGTINGRREVGITGAALPENNEASAELTTANIQPDSVANHVTDRSTCFNVSGYWDWLSSK